MTPRKRTPAPKKPARPVVLPPVAGKTPSRWSTEEPLIFRELVAERGGFPGVTKPGGEGGE